MKRNGVMIMENYKMPVGLGMALAQRPEAMEKFAALSETKKNRKLSMVHIQYHQKKKCDSMWIKSYRNTNVMSLPDFITQGLPHLSETALV
jgi:hypothetical protein